MKVINFIAGPGAGKSTVAAGLFHVMKRAGDNVELVSEYAKDMTWEGRDNILQDQLYMLAKQNRRLQRLEGKVDYAITDSPLLLGAIYTTQDYYKNFIPLVKEVYDGYDNETFMIVRTKEYHTVGRSQTKAQAIEIDDKITLRLDAMCVKYDKIPYEIDLQHLRNVVTVNWDEVAKKL